MTLSDLTRTLNGNSTKSPKQLLLRQLQLERELWRRECRKSLTAWCIEGLRPRRELPARHHQLLIEELEAVERGDTRRLMVAMPPNSAKTTYASKLFPAWFMARNPESHLIGASHGSKFAEDVSKDVIRLIQVNSETLGYATETDAADRWRTTNGCVYRAAGAGATIMGRRADLFIIDDPFQSRAQADSETVRDKIWDWYRGDIYGRLNPGARVILINCMVGDTRVLMTDGTEKALRNVKVGDAVATYRGGRLTSSKVQNWANQGSDCVFTIRMSSGITATANGRHPFLVERDGNLRWVMLRDLRVGEKILRVRRVGEHGEASLAHTTDATSQPSARVIACPTTTKLAGRTESDRHLSPPKTIEPPICGIDMGLASQSMMLYSRGKEANALSAENRLLSEIPASVGACVSIMIPLRVASGDFSATIATSWSDTARSKKFCSEELDTYEIAPDHVVEIMPAGHEDVFDIEIAETGNFIANGLVSHNTRWHEDDLAGRLLAAGHEKWRVISLPAIAEEDDILGRNIGEALWPERFPIADLLQTRRVVDTREWSAQYQQHPAPAEGTYFSRDWLHPVDVLPPMSTLRVYGASDYAVTADGGDYTVHGVVGVDPEDRLWLLDIWRKQASSEAWVEAFCDLVQQWHPVGWAEEQGQIRAGVGPFLLRRMRERRAYVARADFPTRSDKSVRAQSIRGRMALNGLWYDAHAPWRVDLERELLSFPAGKHDDQVDMLGLIGQILDRMTTPPRPRDPDEPVRSLSDMTLDEAWKLADPRQRNKYDHRI